MGGYKGDAAQLLCTPLDNDRERREAAGALVAPGTPRLEDPGR